jgi:hypothetical protein
VFPEILRDLNSLILRQLCGTCNVQEQSAKLGEWRLLVSAAGAFIVTASLRSAPIIAAIVVVVVI